MDKLPRASSDDQRAALKAATRASLKIVNGARFSLVTRVLPPALSNYGSVSEPKDFMPVDIVADMQAEFGRGIASPLLEELAAQAGFRLVPLDDSEDGKPLDLDDVAALIREGGEAKAAALKAASDPACLTTIRTARKELGESITVKSVALRKLASQERRIMARGA